jgi:ACS family tartrate transporter-like MFS transporter
MTNNNSNSRNGIGQKLLAIVWPRSAETIAERTRRRVSLHLIPFLFFLYILAYLDRVNISVASLGMSKPPSEGGLGFDNEVIGFGSGIFFIGYWILEIPSTVSVVRWGARWVFVRILVLWGLCAALVGITGTPFAQTLFNWLPHFPETAVPLLANVVQFINDLPTSAEYQFYFFRFMLGFFEGGFFPSVIVYFSLWFQASDRGKAIASFMAAIPFSNMIGSPLSGLLLEIHWFDLAGWRWVFILEGIVPILAGVATIFLLPDRPADAKWLPADERDWLLGELEREHRAKGAQGHWDWLRDKRSLLFVLLLTGVYFALNFTSYGLAFFMPTIIKKQSGASDVVASCLAGLPYVFALIFMLVNGWHSDRTGERPWHAATPMLLWSVGLFGVAWTSGLGPWPVVVMILGVGPYLYGHLPAYWPIPTMVLGATTAASAIGFINMIGNIGGFFGSNIVGALTKDTDNFVPALRRLAPGPLIAGAIILAMAYARRRFSTKTE